MSTMLWFWFLPLCSTQEVQPLPRFERAVGHYSHFQSFHRFILAHETREVWLDVQIADFEGSTSGDIYFQLWRECDKLGPCEAPTVLKCEGWSFNIVGGKPGQKSGLLKENGWMILRGRFRINGISGPHQGFMAVGLTPLN